MSIQAAVWWMAEYVRTDDPDDLAAARLFLRQVLDCPGDDHQGRDVAVALYDATCYLEGTARRPVMPR